MSFGTCSRCRTDGPLWPGTGLCDDCHWIEQAENADDDDRFDPDRAVDDEDPYAEDDYDDEPAIEDVPTRGLL